MKCVWDGAGFVSIKFSREDNKLGENVRTKTALWFTLLNKNKEVNKPQIFIDES